MFSYRAFHLNVTSEIDLPAVTPTDIIPTLPEATIRRGAVPERLEIGSDSGAWFQVAPYRILLTIENIARYLIADGCAITVDPFPDADPEMVRLFLLGSAMGALLYQRGLLPLHGSAIETPLGAMIFVGPQGIGKSTLAAHFQQRGYRILSDDVCALSIGVTGRLQALPAFPKLRLCPDALDGLGKSGAHLQPARFDGDKFIFPAANGCCSDHPVRLASIHLLSASADSRIAIEPFHGFGRIEQLLVNLYRPEYLHGLASEGNVMRLALRVAQEALLVRVAHDRNPNRIEELIDTLEREWRQNQIFLAERQTHG